MAEKLEVNRAPVMTLWAAVVAEQLGFEEQEALTLAKAVTGLNAQAKGQRLGIFEPGEKNVDEERKRKTNEIFYIDVLGRPVPAINTSDGIRAVNKEKLIQPESVTRYLEQKFGESLTEVRQAMHELARSFDEKELAEKAYMLYEKFRPEIPEGKKGWGARGELDLKMIRSLKKNR
jgi:hypothetical protein